MERRRDSGAPVRRVERVPGRSSTVGNVRFTFPSPWADRVRRGLNLLVGAVGILLTWPLMVLIAVAVKLSSPGPVLFTQLRVGVDRRSGTSPVPMNGGNQRRRNLGGRPFRIYKFRTMTVQAPDAGQVWAARDDPRVTGVGRILRRFRLDELPQLFNVVLGDMNVVGPRPEQPEIFRNLRASLPDYSRRQQVLPGITGWAQVNQESDQTLDDVASKLRYDLEYVGSRSPLGDLKIMAWTVPVMAFGANGGNGRKASASSNGSASQPNGTRGESSPQPAAFPTNQGKGHDLPVAGPETRPRARGS